MNHLGWKHNITFGLFALLSLIQFLAKTGSLSIGPEGFTLRSYFAVRTFRWSDVNGIWVAKVDFKNRVVWNCIREGETKMRPELNPVYGCDGKTYEGMLVDNYGMTLEQLAELLETTRQKHTASLRVCAKINP